MLAPRPTPKLEDHTSSAVRGYLFHLFTATLHIGGRSSIRNPRTRHDMVTRGRYLPSRYHTIPRCVLNAVFFASFTKGRYVYGFYTQLLPKRASAESAVRNSLRHCHNGIVNNCPTGCDYIQFYYIFCRQLYMFRMIPSSIIRSTLKTVITTSGTSRTVFATVR